MSPTDVDGGVQIRYSLIEDVTNILGSFRSQALDGYGIKIFVDTLNTGSAYDHFQTSAPDNETWPNILDWYHNKHPDSYVWLSITSTDEETIKLKYESLRRIAAVEAKFAFQALTYFFKDDDTEHHPLKRTRKSYRELNWGPTPDASRYIYSVPRVSDSTRVLTFDTNPDCSYWLNLQQINGEYMSYVEDFTYVRKPAEAAVPYLTIEFKKAQTSESDCVNQLAISMALMLFNRVFLRSKRLQKSGRPFKQWKKDDFEQMTHYGIAFNANKALVVQMIPQLDFTKIRIERSVNHPWAGCTLCKLKMLDVEKPGDAIKLSTWINEIHNWGLADHSTEFEMDIKTMIYCSEMNRARSKVSFTAEELKKLQIG